MLLHVDGARLANAAAALGLPLRAITTDAGVDAVSFGGTKNGLMLGEAVVFLRDGPRRRTSRSSASSRCSSPRRCASSPRSSRRCSTDDLWQRPAAHANAMAARLAGALGSIGGVQITQTVEANAVFALLPAGRHRPAPGALALLRLGRDHRRGALDVLVGHHRGRRRRVRRGRPRGARLTTGRRPPARALCARASPRARSHAGASGRRASSWRYVRACARCPARAMPTRRSPARSSHGRAA